MDKLFEEYYQNYSLQDPNQPLSNTGMLNKPSKPPNLSLAYELEFNEYVNSRDFQHNFTSERTKNYVLTGIPYSHKQLFYVKVLKDVSAPDITIKVENAEQILKDINRAFPHTHFLNTKSGLFLLFDVALKSSNSYSQPLIKPLAYLVLSTGRLAYSLGPKFAFKYSVFTHPAESKLYQFQTLELLQQLDLELAEAFDYANFLMPWLVSCLHNCLEFEPWERFFDCFLYFGMDFLVAGACALVLEAGKGERFSVRGEDEEQRMDRFEALPDAQKQKMSIIGVPECYAFEKLKNAGRGVEIGQFLQDCHAVMLHMK
ncbi:TBC domain-containing protein [Spironucleus salmonicida]|uniref:TBC domain-containing protein n=1 Tax=Spironucleus salmonicida TaxID=348837 RepID=V6LG85_9EUKA|nr:TBC domain-containing protein [Spironucleus salmonicida]|eukprot:EST43570.1 TBC domain-containing protein [Spironucleus salmonicida]